MSKLYSENKFGQYERHYNSIVGTKYDFGLLPDKIKSAYIDSVETTFDFQVLGLLQKLIFFSK